MPETSDGGRRFQRVKLTQQVVGNLDASKALVLEISREDALVAHQLPSHEGDRATLRFDWQGQSFVGEGTIGATELHRKPTTPGAKAVHRSEFTFTSVDPLYLSALKLMIADLVARALDEQKANAKGIPPAAASSYQAGAKGRGYVSLRLVQGKWQKVEAATPEQPMDGFTVSVDEDPEQIRMLCSSYETAGYEDRKMIRQMAQLSISASDGIPTRRYEP